MYLTCFGGLEQFSQGNESVFTTDYLIGPGREVQIAAFAQAVLEKESTGMKRILILCPPIKTKIWSDEIQKSFDYVDPEQRQLVDDLCDGEDIFEHIESLKMWTRCGGVGIMDLDLFQRLDNYYTEDDNNMDIIQTALFNPGPDIVFFDYESMDKRSIPKKYTGLVKISTTRRIILPDLYSHNPIQHISRVIFRDWLMGIGKGCYEQHYPSFLQFSDLVGYHMQRDVRWVKNEGFAVERTNGCNSYLKSELPTKWRNHTSQVSKAYDQTPERKRKTKSKHPSDIPPTHVLYILVVSPSVGQLTADNLADPNFKMYIYIGQWDSGTRGGLITARISHFYDPRDPVFILLSDPSNQCHQVVAVQCYNQFSAHNGEAYLLEYADEWNRVHPDGARFIITKPEVQHLDEYGTLRKEARQRAKDGVWIFQKFNKDAKPNPSPLPKFADLCKLPFRIDQTCIKERVIIRGAKKGRK
ncbi:uncharacterized protein LOC110845347 [Folsomia candida]|nr:uncharacterized protein LOC110845347 [Folsomia candida]